MLDFFRRQRSRLKWIWILVIFIFSVTLVTLYIPVGDLSSVTLTNDVADVGNEAITAREFQLAYRSYVNQAPADMTPETMRAIRVERQIVDALIDRYVIIAEAKRLGLAVSAAEIEKLILENPAFQDGGSFIGLSRYESLLLQNNLTVTEYEDSIHNQMLMEKLHSFLTSAATVPREAVETEYRNRHEKVRLDYFLINAPSFSQEVKFSADEQREYFEKNLARYNIPEKRQAHYIFVDTIKIRTEMEISDDELLAYYKDHEQEYALQARVRAQHILWKTQGQTPEQIEDIRNTAQEVLRQAKDGVDFSELARKYSEDTSASVGGDIGFFEPGQMVPEFERAAFGLEAGATSELVETEFGIHIIRVNGKEDARIQPFEEVRTGIDSIVKFRRAAEASATTAQAISVDLVGNPDLETIAATHNAEVRETGPIGREETIAGLEETGELRNRIFSMTVDDIGTAVPVRDGFTIPVVTEVLDAHQASFDEAKEQVAVDLRAEKSIELAREKSIEARRLLEAGSSFTAAAKAVRLDIQTSDLITRGGFIGAFGSTASLDDQLFSLATGITGTPVTVGGKTIVFKVTEKEEINPEQMKADFDDLHEELMFMKRNQLFEAYNGEVRERMERQGEIVINDQVLLELTRTIS